MRITPVFSICPNDTFIFDAIMHQEVNTEGLNFDVVLAGVEELNRIASSGNIDISKFNFHVNATSGKYITSNILFSVVFPDEKEKKEYLFSDIGEAILDGEVNAGVIIHENRVTF